MDMTRDTKNLHVMEINSLDAFPFDNELQISELKIKYVLVCILTTPIKCMSLFINLV